MRSATVLIGLPFLTQMPEPSPDRNAAATTGTGEEERKTGRGGVEERAGIEYYFLEERGTVFKAQVPFAPYFYAVTGPGQEAEAQERGLT